MVPSRETVKNWVEQAEGDRRLKPIIAEVEAKYQLEVAIVDEGEWSCAVDGTRAVISIAETGRPLAAFAHELLHLRLSARGYRHILGCGNHDESKNKLISCLLSAFDNELQHHKMFPDFVSAGFDGADFYADSDDTAHEFVQHQINQMSFATTGPVAALTYLSIMAPGGSWPMGSQEALADQFRLKVSEDVWESLLAMEAAFSTWKISNDLDPTDIIVTIFEALGDLDGTFIGEDVSHYPTGAFIPRSLTQTQFEALENR